MYATQPKTSTRQFIGRKVSHSQNFFSTREAQTWVLITTQIAEVQGRIRIVHRMEEAAWNRSRVENCSKYSA